jgi:hypothetical protein
VSTSALAKQLKELLGAESNAAVVEKVRQLQQAVAPDVIVVAVRWEVGAPPESAGVSLLSGQQNIALTHVNAALRAGQSVVERQIEQVAAQAQSEAARLRAELQKAQKREPGEA